MFKKVFLVVFALFILTLVIGLAVWDSTETSVCRMHKLKRQVVSFTSKINLLPSLPSILQDACGCMAATTS